MNGRPTALIAEDEPLLRDALARQLAQAWPELEIVALARNGREAIRLFDARMPDVCFLDVHMPGISGIEAARHIGRRAHLVFVTAYDQYALQAFEAQAVDYVLKPVQPARLAKTVEKIRAVLARRSAAAPDLEATLGQLRHLLRAAEPQAAPQPLLKVIQASVGSAIRMVPVDEVVYFEAADKYVRVVCPDAEVLIRTPLKELLPQLDAQLFWQVHRGTVVRSTAIESVHRDETGKLHLALRGRAERLPVSRLYAHLFKAM